jgi:filamentous hemagglutinin family protein
MRCVTSLRLLALSALIGWDGASGAPPTTLTPNGFGTTVSLPVAGTYNITGGTTAGTNLFHSFSTFNVGTGNTANFNVSNSVANIFARVTGGPSTVDGTITSTIGTTAVLSSANLWFLNPAGVMFTANAQVNLGGSFIVSTANRVEFADGSMFYGDVNHPVQDAGLTAAPVSAFGFLNATPQPVSFVGTQLYPAHGTGIHVIGGDLSLNDASLFPAGGSVSLFSAAGSGEVPFSIASPGAGYATATVSHLGAITMTNGSQAEVDTYGGSPGTVVIRGGKITDDASSIASENYGTDPGDNVSVQADQLTVSDAGNILTDTFSSQKSGNVMVNVSGDLEVTGTESQISADTESNGNGGTVTANVAGTVRLDDGGDLLAFTDSSGHSGTVDIEANSMSLNGNSRINTGALGSGDAGTVNLTLRGPLTMADTSGILADTYGAGQGGDITVAAPQISMTGESTISADTLFFSTGRGGNVNIQTNMLSIQGTSSTHLGTLGITTESLSAGSPSAGVINVNATSLFLDGNALISSGNFSAGDGGSVSIACSQGELSRGSVVRASSYAGNAGSILIMASDLFTVSGDSSISASAGLNGGDITLLVDRLLYLNDSNIQAYAGAGFDPPAGTKGGNIRIDPQFVVLNNSLISANDLSPGGQDGNIVNSADFFFSSDSILHATGTIDTTAPDLNLAQSLAFLPSNLVSAENRLRERCSTSTNHEFSTFIVVGRGGIENAPEELQPDFGATPDLPTDPRAK